MSGSPHSIDLIVLGTTKFAENGIVLHSLSREYGRRGWLVRVGKKGGQGPMMPLSLVEAEIVPNQKSELWTARHLHETVPLPGIRGNMGKNAMTLFLSEVLLRAVRDGVNEPGLFEWAEKSILTLDSLQGGYPNYPLRWLLEFAAAMGFRPTLEDIAPFAGEQLPALKALVESDFSATLLLPLKGEQRNSLCESLLHYLEYHLEVPLNVRSLAVLRELFV